MSKEKKKVVAKIKVYYKDNNDKVVCSVVDILRDTYIASLPYKEILEDAMIELAESYGAWINDKLFIPLHRILSVEALNNSKKTDTVKSNNQSTQPNQNRPNFNKNKRRLNKRHRPNVENKDKNTNNGTSNQPQSTE